MINALLVLVAAFFGLKAYGVWSQENWSDPGTGTDKSGRIKSVERPVGRLFERKAPPESAYSVVINKNLFSAKRREAQPDKAKQKATDDGRDLVSSKQAELFLKRIMLYGVIITDDYAAALVTNVGKMTAPLTGRRSRSDEVANETLHAEREILRSTVPGRRNRCQQCSCRNCI